jgi:hypothetical protein
MKSSIPENCLWGSARFCHVAPIHFWAPIGGPVLSLHVRAPLPVPRKPPAKDPACNEVDLLIPLNRLEAHYAPVVRSPFNFGHILRPGFEFSPRAHAGPRAAAVEDKGFGLSGMLVMLSTLPYYFQILATRHVAASLCPRPVSRARSPQRLYVAHTGSRNEAIAGRGVACWFWPGTRPLQLLAVYCRTKCYYVYVGGDTKYSTTAMFSTYDKLYIYIGNN